MLGAYLIYLYRVEILPRECVHLQSTHFRVSCGDIIEIFLCGIWIRCVIPSFLGVFGKAYNLMDCTDLAVLTRMKHTLGLATVDFDESSDLFVITMLKTPDHSIAPSMVTSLSYVSQCKY